MTWTGEGDFATLVTALEEPWQDLENGLSPFSRSGGKKDLKGFRGKLFKEVSEISGIILEMLRPPSDPGKFQNPREQSRAKAHE